MLKKISNGLLALIVVGILVVIVASGLFIYSQKNKNGGEVTKSGEVLYDENIIPEWASYTHPLLGYTIEYPKNILSQIKPGDSLYDMYFYKNSSEENPQIFVSLRNSQAFSIGERNRLLPTETTKKMIISGVDAYVITDRKYPNRLSAELAKDGVYYSVGVGGLSPTSIEHIINSFHIDFVPDLQNVNLVPKSKEFMANENIVPEWASYTNSSLGYTLEYPKNILSLIEFDEARSRVYFYKKSPGENPRLDVKVLPSRGLSVRELTAGDRAASTSQKITISGTDTSLLAFREFPNSPFIQFTKNGVFYSISFGELPESIIDHIIKSFRIDFVPESIKLY